MPVVSELKSARISPRKATVVASLIQHRSVADALVILENTPRKAAHFIKKALVSAKANAEHNHNFKTDGLFIVEVAVNSGPRYKRFRPAARGRALRYKHETSHIKVTIDGELRQKKSSEEKLAKKETA